MFCNVANCRVSIKLAYPAGDCTLRRRGSDALFSNYFGGGLVIILIISEQKRCFVHFCVIYLTANTAVVVYCPQIRENHRQKQKEMKNFAELVSRTSKHSTLKVNFLISPIILHYCRFNDNLLCSTDNMVYLFCAGCAGNGCEG